MKKILLGLLFLLGSIEGFSSLAQEAESAKSVEEKQAMTPEVEVETDPIADEERAEEEVKEDSADVDTVGEEKPRVPEDLPIWFYLVFGLAILLAVVGNILFLIGAFSESVGWGVACLFLPFVSFFFLVCHWNRAKAGFLCSLAGVALATVAVLATAVQVAEAPQTEGDNEKNQPIEAMENH